MKKRICVFLLFLLCISTHLLAQTEDFGVWTTLGAEKKLGKWNIGAEGELRTKSNSEQIARWSLRLEGSYNIIKSLKMGAGYQYIYFHDFKYSNFQPRNRFYFFLQEKRKMGDFTFTLRERIQVTTKDESDRIKSNGKIDTYKINPDYSWRNRLKIDYNIPRCPVSPSLSVESFCQLNNPDGNKFDDMRYTLSFKYNLTKHNEIEIYGLVDKEMNVKKPEKKFVTGIGYVHSF